jgi:hypothetical protein
MLRTSVTKEQVELLIETFAYPVERDGQLVWEIPAWLSALKLYVDLMPALPRGTVLCQ